MLLKKPEQLPDQTKIIRFFNDEGLKYSLGFPEKVPTFKLGPKKGYKDNCEGCTQIEKNKILQNLVFCINSLISCWSILPFTKEELINLYQDRKKDQENKQQYAIISTIGKVSKIIQNINEFINSAYPEIFPRFDHGKVCYYYPNEILDSRLYETKDAMFSGCEDFYKRAGKLGEGYSWEKEYRFRIYGNLYDENSEQLLSKINGGLFETDLFYIEEIYFFDHPESNTFIKKYLVDKKIQYSDIIIETVQA